MVSTHSYRRCRRRRGEQVLRSPPFTTTAAHRRQTGTGIENRKLWRLRRNAPRSTTTTTTTTRNDERASTTNKRKPASSACGGATATARRQRQWRPWACSAYTVRPGSNHRLAPVRPPAAGGGSRVTMRHCKDRPTDRPIGRGSTHQKPCE